MKNKVSSGVIVIFGGRGFGGVFGAAGRLAYTLADFRGAGSAHPAGFGGACMAKPVLPPAYLGNQKPDAGR
ncbi:exported hypothetical protein [Candidatus Sulfopaludibacter sp. SbA4]|nr:exported hypothetical protein [Candidatus Sulfopaludibacter sp. SbA4]